MADLADMPPHRGVRFSLDVNLGHVLIVLSMVGSGAIIYADIKSTVATHEYRLGAVEKAQTDGLLEQRDFFKEIRTTLKELARGVGDVQRAVDGKQDRPR